MSRSNSAFDFHESLGNLKLQSCRRRNYKENLIIPKTELADKNHDQIRVIGAGFGRTGTFTLKSALNQLGFKCYHMSEVTKHKHFPLWWEIHKLEMKKRKKSKDDGNINEGINFGAIFDKENFDAIVDEPGNRFYCQLMSFYPNAKVILTVREYDSWRVSFMKSIYPVVELVVNHWLVKLVNIYPYLLIHNCIFATFHGMDNFANNPKQCQTIFNDWNQQVIDNVPKDKLLIFDVTKHGWKELCQFLNVDLPKGVKNGDSLPRLNSTQNMIDEANFAHKMLRIADFVVITLILLFLGWIISFFVA